MAQLKSIWHWITGARHVWLSVGIVVSALLVCLRPDTSERLIRITGLILQLFGICTVVWGISETRALFGHPSLFSKAKSYLGRFPLLHKSHIISGSPAGFMALSAKAHAHQTFGSGENPTTESRLEALEKNIESIHARITGTQNELDVELGKISGALQTEIGLRVSEDQAIRDKLEATGTGGIHISAIGTLLLFVGVVLSTVAPEIADFLK